MAESAVVIFAKAPVPGRVKTRLQPCLTPDECASLSESFIMDTVRTAKRVGGADTFLACYPDATHPFLRLVSKEFEVELMPQEGMDLGERMDNAIKGLISKGYRKVVLIGSDSPDLPAEYIEDALRRLDSHEMVIGPSIDGGYYLIGGKRGLPVFDNIPWSTAKVFDLTIKRAKERGVSFFVLKEWHDVDTWGDLQMLQKRRRLP